MAVVLRRFNDINESTRPTAAVAIKAISPSQRHIGLVYGEGENLWILHLAWHYDLRREVPSTYFLVEHKFAAWRMRQVAARCRQIVKANPKGLPYAFSYPNGCFDQQTGRYLFGSSQIGLTCATFVLAIFEVAGIRLLDIESWPSNRDGDSEWQEVVLLHLRQGRDNGRVTQEHIDDVEKQVGAVRCRPEEVAGSTAWETHPIQFDLAVQLGEQVLAHLNNQ
jgi:hypothetical protein